MRPFIGTVMLKSTRSYERDHTTLFDALRELGLNPPALTSGISRTPCPLPGSRCLNPPALTSGIGQGGGHG